MNTLSFVFLLAVTYMAVGIEGKIYYDLRDAPALFAKFVSAYNRNYKDSYDMILHYEAFVKNLVDINRLNARDTGTTYDINQFADFTDEEKRHYNGGKFPLTIY